MKVFGDGSSSVANFGQTANRVMYWGSAQYPLLFAISLVNESDHPRVRYMLIIYVDADACPVKNEVYGVARRYGMSVVIVANAPLRVPGDALIELVVRPGFGTADDYIAETIGPGDVAITADIPLASRCLQKGGRVLDPRGRELMDNDIGAALGMRDLMDHLRQGGTMTGGPSPMKPKDRSRFLSKLDEIVTALRRANKC
jgi:uncharacterized protein YaiI (UPF0178 family)